VSDGSYEVLVIGGSFAGLAAALQLARARRRVLIIDAGKPRNRFAHESHGFLGQDGRSPADILRAFRGDVATYPTIALREDEAKDAHVAGDDGFVVELASGESVRARRLILATGVSDDLPPITGLAERWGVTVLHCPYCHGYEVRDRRLGVLARTAETAMHQAMLLPDWSGDITLFTNGAFEPDGAQRATLAARRVAVESRRIDALLGGVPELSGVRLHDGTVVRVDALFTVPKTRPASPLAERLGCAMDEGPSGHFVRTDDKKETTVPGVFCAGDAARAGHNATWAAADGVTAGFAAHRSLVYATPVAR
jgi:thioredoxin reductase